VVVCADLAADVHSAREVALGALEAAAASRGCSGALQGLSSEATSSRLRFALWSCDHLNVVRGEPKRGDRQLKVALKREGALLPSLRVLF
jgi:hypothetical protein